MARYRILYWGHIPLGVKATDVQGTIRINLPARFQEAFGSAAIQDRPGSRAIHTTSNFRWSEEKVREGTAARVAAAVARELDETWDEEQALTTFEQQQVQSSGNFLDLNRLR